MTSLTLIRSSDTNVNLLVEIVSGPRRGVALQLRNAGARQEESVVLREDEAIEFTLVLKQYHPSLYLVLHDIEMQCARFYEQDGYWIYRWVPRESYGRKEAFFHNYFGLAEMAVVGRGSVDQADFDLFIPFHPIEVLAKKLNADRVSAMLEFLCRQDAKDLASAIRVTRIRAGYKEGGRTENFLIERLEHNLNFLRKALPVLGSRPLSRLTQESRLVVPNEETLIDERSLGWILENPDCLYETASVDNAILSTDGAYYATHKILEGQAQNSFDLYENQVLHGFVSTLIAGAKSILEKLKQEPQRNFKGMAEFDGYVSFFSQIRKLTHAINKNKVERCERIVEELGRMRAWLKKQVPVKKIFLGVPQFTQKAKYNMLYQQVFSRMISWHRYGAPDWGFQDELNSIKDIPKLFEYYTLCVIKAHLDECAERIQNYEGEEVVDVFEYIYGEMQLRLLYEPLLWSAGHNNAVGQRLVNSEGWTVKSTSWMGGLAEKRVSERSSVGPNSNRCPDFLIELSSNDGESLYFIIDAKYTDSKRAFLGYLPELTMKYVHGIHEQRSGRSLAAGLMIVNPSESPATQHFHHGRYSIYGDNPVTPALLVSSIDVSNAHHADSNLRANLTRVMELMRGRLDFTLIGKAS